MDMAKFTSEEDPGFIAVSGELRRWMSQIQPQIQQSWRYIIQDSFADLPPQGAESHGWYKDKISQNPTYKNKAHGNLLDNTYLPTSSIVDYNINSGLIIYEDDEETEKQDTAWNSFRGLSSPINSDFRYTLKIGHVIARQLTPSDGSTDLHGAGMLLRLFGGTMLGFVFTGQDEKAHLVNVSDHRITRYSDCLVDFPRPVPCAQEPDRWPGAERDHTRLGCTMILTRVNGQTKWCITDAVRTSATKSVEKDVTRYASGLAGPIEDFGVCLFGRGCCAILGFALEIPHRLISD